MKLLPKIAVLFVALEHVLFFVLEAFLWTSDVGRQTFGTTPESAETMKSLAMNQGLYNAFLAAALVLSALARDKRLARVGASFALACVVVAGIVGAFTAKIDILFVQALPGAVALVLVRLDRDRA